MFDSWALLQHGKKRMGLFHAALFSYTDRSGFMNTNSDLFFIGKLASDHPDAQVAVGRDVPNGPTTLSCALLSVSSVQLLSPFGKVILHSL